VVNPRGVELATPVRAHEWPPLQAAQRDALTLTDPQLSLTQLELSAPTHHQDLHLEGEGVDRDI